MTNSTDDRIPKTPRIPLLNLFSGPYVKINLGEGKQAHVTQSPLGTSMFTGGVDVCVDEKNVKIIFKYNDQGQLMEQFKSYLLNNEQKAFRALKTLSVLRHLNVDIKTYTNEDTSELSCDLNVRFSIIMTALILQEQPAYDNFIFLQLDKKEGGIIFTLDNDIISILKKDSPLEAIQEITRRMETVLDLNTNTSIPHQKRKRHKQKNNTTPGAPSSNLSSVEPAQPHPPTQGWYDWLIGPGQSAGCTLL